MRARLSVLRSLVPIARIAFSMSVEHDVMGKLKKVLIYIFRSIPVQHSGSAVSSQKCKNRLFLMSVRP